MRSFKDKATLALQDQQNKLGIITEIVLGIINLIACTVYVLESYSWSETTFFYFHVAEWTLVSIFIIEYALRIWTAEKKWNYVFSFYGVVDFLSIAPILFTFEGSGFVRALKMLRLLRILRLARLLREEGVVSTHISELQLQFARVLSTIFMLIFISSGIIHFVEAAPGVDENTIHTFGDAVYFTVTTMTTVGFGDLVAVTDTGRLTVVLMILSAIILIPWQTGQLVRLLIRSERGKREAVCKQCGLMYHDHDASHCKACGHVIFQEYEGDD